MSKSRRTVAADVMIELMEKFPNAGSMTLAKIARKEHPKLYASVEAARTIVRRYRGAHGEKVRASVKRRVERTRTHAETIRPVPPAKQHFDWEWTAFDIPLPCHALVLSDVHVPYHDEAAFQAACDEGVKRGVDTVIINGDFLDFFSLSRWEKDPRKRDFAGERDTGRAMLAYLRGRFPKARMYFKEGNHEERYESYMRVKCPEFLGLAEFEWESVFKLDEHGFEVVGKRDGRASRVIGDKRPLRLGKMFLIHGHEYRFNISNPVNPARGIFLRAKVSCLAGHFHQTSQHSEKNLAQHVVSTWSQGCLAQLHTDYAPLNNHNHGFAVIRVDQDGVFDVDNLRVIDGRAY